MYIAMEEFSGYWDFYNENEGRNKILFKYSVFPKCIHNLNGHKCIVHWIRPVDA